MNQPSETAPSPDLLCAARHSTYIEEIAVFGGVATCRTMRDARSGWSCDGALWREPPSLFQMRFEPGAAGK